MHEKISPLANLEMVPVEIDNIPERSLLVEILRLAVRDVINANQGKRCGNNHHRKQALHWLESDEFESNCDKFTFLQVCEELNLCPHRVRKEICININNQSFQMLFERKAVSNYFPRPR